MWRWLLACVTIVAAVSVAGEIELSGGEQENVPPANTYRLSGWVFGCERDPYHEAGIVFEAVGDGANRPRFTIVQTDQGRFEVDLPAGSYMVQVAERSTRTEDGGIRIDSRPIRSEGIVLDEQPPEKIMVICSENRSRLEYSPWRRLGVTTWR